MAQAKNKELTGGGSGGDLEDREAAAMQRVLDAKAGDQGGSDWKVFVMRLAGPNRRKDGTEARIMELAGLDDLETLSEEVRKEFGDGLYRIRVRKDGRNIEQWDFEVELSPAERAVFRRKLAQLDEQPAQLPAVREGGSEIAQVIAQAMRYQTDTMKDLIATVRPTQPADPMAQFGTMMAAFKGFQEAMPRSEQATGLSMFEKGMQFAEKFMDRGAGGAEPASLLGVVREVLANPEIGGALKEFAKGAARMAQNPQGPGGPRVMRQLPPNQRPAPNQRPQPAPRPAPAPEPAAPGATAEQRAIEYLIGQAAMGAQPELAANTALELIPQERLALLDALPEEEALNLLMNFYPEAQPHRDWFAALLKAMYEDEAAPSVNEDEESEGKSALEPS